MQIWVAVLGIVATVLTLVGGKILETRAKIKAEIRKEKREVFSQLLRFLSGLFLDVKLKRKVNPEKASEFLFDWGNNLMMWGSADFVHVYNLLLYKLDQLEAVSKENEPAYQSALEHVMGAYGTLLKTVRTELIGSDDVGVEALLGIFISDFRKASIEKQIAAYESSKGEPK